jgi:hypothetical protein
MYQIPKVEIFWSSFDISSGGYLEFLCHFALKKGHKIFYFPEVQTQGSFPKIIIRTKWKKKNGQSWQKSGKWITLKILSEHSTFDPGVEIHKKNRLKFQIKVSSIFVILNMEYGCVANSIYSVYKFFFKYKLIIWCYFIL